MKKSFILAAAVCAALVGGSVMAQEKVAITPELIAKAKQEGQVTLRYGSPLITMQAIVKDFNKTYPDIKVHLERKPGAAGAQSLMQEMDAGVHRTDVVQGTEVNSNAELIAHKAFVPFVPANIDEFKPTALSMAPYLYAPTTVSSIVMYNPRMVTEAEVEKLKRWDGILDPAFKGRLSIIEPSVGASAAPLLYIMNNPKLGSEFLKKLKAQNPVIYLNTTLGREAVTSGQQAISIFSQFDSIALTDFGRGSPVRFLYPTPTVEYVSSFWGIMNNAPHPNAARLLVAWILSRDGGLSFQGPLSNSRSTLKDLEDTRAVLKKIRATGWYKPPVEIWNPNVKDWVDNLDKYQETWTNIMKPKR